MVKRYANYDLSGRNTFRMRVRCALFVEITEENDLVALDWNALPQPVLVMGGGSNLLFTGDFPGTVLHFGSGVDLVQGCGGPGPISGAGPGPTTMPSSGLQGTCVGPGPGDKIGPGPTVLVTLQAGTVFDDFCAWAAAEGLWGPENLSLIPGEVGASAVQNIGAYGVEAKDIIADIRAWDRTTGQFVHIDPATCGYGYRTSKFKTEWQDRYIITAVTYRLSKDPLPKLDYGGVRKVLPDDPLTPQLIRDTIISIRNQKLPAVAELGSAGSFFCNPVVPEEVFRSIPGDPPHYVVDGGIKVPAAWLIEQCGLKGAVNGGAQVYQNQPLVIVNASGEATPQDIIGLENQVIEAVRAKFGITLHPEVQHV